jgi:hypothetical protein
VSTEVASSAERPALAESDHKEQRSAESGERRPDRRSSDEKSKEMLASTLAPPSRTPEAPPAEKQQSPSSLLEFDTLAPGFFPSSPGFSEERNTTPREADTTTIGFRFFLHIYHFGTLAEQKEEEPMLLLLDSGNGTAEHINDSSNNGSKFWGKGQLPAQVEYFLFHHRV